MDISGVSNINSAIQQVNGKTFDKEDFMKILLKQLNYQDPLNPMDSTQFTSQLTQFSSLEQLTNLNTTLEDVLAYQQSIQNASITDLIGRTVRVEGDSTYLNNTADINYELSKDAASVKISIYDRAGRLVATKEAGPQAAGNNTFVWDGTDSSGAQMPAGDYTFEVKANNASGAVVDAVTNSFGTVTGINFEDGLSYIVLDDGRNITLSEIKSIQ
jgi:flagellar basal-body rod modification protein FlgD